MKAYADTKREMVYSEDGTEYRLTPQIWDLIAYLASRSGELVTLRDIAEHCYMVHDDIKVHVLRLRKATWPAIVVNYRGHGYMTDVVLR